MSDDDYSLTPVDHDPFTPPAAQAGVTMTPVDHDPFAGSTVNRSEPNGSGNVDHDPFQAGIDYANSLPPDTPTPNPVVASGSLLPLSRYQDGSVGFDSNAGILGKLKNAFSLPGDVATGKIDPTSTEAIQRSADLAGFFSTPALSTSTADPSALGIFAGQKSATADLAALRTAQTLDRSGSSQAAIHSATGWFKGVDGQWRYEISDAGASMIPDAVNSGKNGVMGDALNHPELYKAYPDLQNMPLSFGGLPSGVYGQYNPLSQPPSIALNPAEAGNGLYSTTLHELQHAVQGVEGFHNGSNSRYFENYPQPSDAWTSLMKQAENNPQAKEIYNMMRDNRPQYLAHVDGAHKLFQEHFAQHISDETIPDEKKLQIFDLFTRTRDQAFPLVAKYGRLESYLADNGLPTEIPAKTTMDPYDAYHRTVGEVEARNVQTRHDMSPEMRRTVPPWLTQSVPDQQQVQFQLTPVDHNPFAGEQP